MKKGISAAIITLFICLAFFCCKQEKSEFADEILAAVKKNAKAVNTEDVEAYMSTIHKDSPAYSESRGKMEKAFKEYDLQIDIKSLTVKEASGEEAKVEFVQVTSSKGGKKYNDNRMTGVHLLRKSGEDWKIYKTEVRNIEYPQETG